MLTSKEMTLITILGNDACLFGLIDGCAVWWASVLWSTRVSGDPDVGAAAGISCGGVCSADHSFFPRCFREMDGGGLVQEQFMQPTGKSSAWILV